MTAAPPVLIRRGPRALLLELNRPRAINALTYDMIQLLREGLETARHDPQVQFVLLTGAGERGFCAGGDVKAVAAAVAEGQLTAAVAFFREEYALDLALHEFPKPVVVLAAGITMGGGLGLAAGADVVVATETTRIAMPETRIGFFPDVGASGWLFTTCPPGYPEYLALTGYDMQGAECVRLGLATDLVPAEALHQVRQRYADYAGDLPRERSAAATVLREVLAPWREMAIPADPERDRWVAEHFAGKRSVPAILASLTTCSLENPYCRQVHESLGERSPTALTLTLALLRRHQGKNLATVFAGELAAARFIIQHPDYQEGIRARLLDRDDRPQWQPASLGAVRLPEAEIFGGG